MRRGATSSAMPREAQRDSLTLRNPLVHPLVDFDKALSREGITLVTKTRCRILPAGQCVV